MAQGTSGQMKPDGLPRVAGPLYPAPMPPQHLILTPVVPAGTELTFSLYRATYRVVGRVAGEQVFRFDLSPTYTALFDKVIEAAVRADWTLGPEAAGELKG